MINKKAVKRLKEVYPFFIFLSIIGLLMSVIYIYIHTKDKNPYFIISALLCFLLPCLMTSGMLLNSEKLVVSAFFFPITLFLIATFIETLVRYKNCTYAIAAKCVSFQTRGKGWYYAPQFSFRYNGETVLAYSFASYSKRKFKKNFEINQIYDIFINPDKPTYCVDKRFFPGGTIVYLIFMVIFLLLGIVVVISI